MDRRWSLWRDLERLLDRSWTKVVLSILIVVSVLPLAAIENVLGPVLLCVFGTELALRISVHLRHMRREGGSPWSGRLLLGIDFIAVLTFVPLPSETLGHLAEPLRLLRLVRLVLLARYGAQAARDLYGILTRRERLQHFVLITFIVALLALLSSVLLLQFSPARDWDEDGVVSYDLDGDGAVAGREKVRELFDVMWWSFRQLESGDNLVRSLDEHPLVFAVSLCLTVAGFVVLAFIIGIGASVLEQLVASERQKPVGLHNHSVIVGPVHKAEPLVRELARLYEKNRWIRTARPPGLKGLRRALSDRRHPFGYFQGSRPTEVRMALLGREEEPPAYIYDARLRTVAYRQGDPADPAALARVDVHSAKRVIVLAHPLAGDDADAIAISTVMAVRRVNQRARVYVELRGAGEATQVAHACGGDRTYPLEISRLIGLFLCQHLVVPGVDRLYEELLTAEGSEIYTHVVNLPWEFEALGKLPAQWNGRSMSFGDLLLGAYERHHVVLLGAMLGTKTHSMSADKLALHLNPAAAEPEPEPAGLGATCGGIPIGALRGFVGLSPTYAELQATAVDLISGWVPRATTAPAPAHEMPLRLDDGGVGKLLVIGDNDALPSMLGELVQFVSGAEVVVALEDAPGREPIERRVGRLSATERGGPERGVFELQAGRAGRIRCIRFEQLDIGAVARDPVVRRSGPYDAVVFLSDPHATDADARTALRVLQLASRVESREIEVGPQLHIVMEVGSPLKGSLVLPRLNRVSRSGGTSLRTTLVSSEILKNYFMVHSAFVPGIPGIYGELLTDRGQKFLRLEVSKPWPSRPVRFRDLLNRLSHHQLIPLGVELRDRSVIINPHVSDQAIPADQVAAVFAVGDSRALSERTDGLA